MAVSAIVLRPVSSDFQEAELYYRAAPHEPTAKGLLKVGAYASFRGSFHSLLAAIIANKRDHVIVLAHGDPERGLDLEVDSTVPADLTPDALALLLKVVDNLSSDGKSADPKALFAFTDYTKVTDAVGLSIAQKCAKIRSVGTLASEVHFRACEVGANRLYLRNLRRLFGATEVSAPICPMLFSMVRPLGGPPPKPTNDPARDVVAWGAKNPPKTRRFIYEADEHGPMLLDLDYIPATHKAPSVAAVQSKADIRKWAKVFHQNPNTPSYEYFPIAALWPNARNDYWLPHESGYTSFIHTETF